MRSFLLKLLFMCFVVLPIFSSAAWALDIRNIRFGVHPDKTRIVIELSDNVAFKVFTLPREAQQPYRIIVDLPQFNWQAGTVSQPAKTTVSDVRSGSLNNMIDRIVIDLSKPALVKDAFVLPRSGKTPTRLVIDYVSVSDVQFSQSQQNSFGSLPEAQTIGQIIPNNAPASSGIVLPERKPVVLSNTVPAPPKAQSPLRKPLIVIDAGHGGNDPGAIGAGKIYEKNVTLAAARALKSKLESTGRYSVHLTRDSDIYLKLYERRNIARQRDADLFISLHADSIDKPNVQGASIYTLSDKASDSQTAKLATRENQADLIAGVDLSHEDKDVANILIDLAMRDTMNQSKFFANNVVSQMGRYGIKTLPGPHRYAGFAVLKSPDVPSVLIELGFMSNRAEVHLLSSRDYQDKIAATLTQSIDAYFEKVRKNSIQ